MEAGYPYQLNETCTDERRVIKGLVENNHKTLYRGLDWPLGRVEGGYSSCVQTGNIVSDK